VIPNHAAEFLLFANLRILHVGELLQLYFFREFFGKVGIASLDLESLPSLVVAEWSPAFCRSDAAEGRKRSALCDVNPRFIALYVFVASLFQAGILAP